MTNRKESPNARRLACSACGTVFTCGLGEVCWCMDETVRLPMPVEGQDGNGSGKQDCLCRDCLRQMAEKGAMAK
jgi:Cysteine-rich CWC